MKLKVRSHKAAKKAGRSGRVVAKVLHSPGGEPVRVHAIDANSASFSDDFLYVFKQNVRAAREENVKLFGSPDRVEKAD